MRFPFIGSAVLFGLYVVIKFANKAYLDILIACYFSFIGAFGMFGTIREPMTIMMKADNAPRWTRSFHYQFWRKAEQRGEFAASHRTLVHTRFTFVSGTRDSVVCDPCKPPDHVASMASIVLRILTASLQSRSS